MIERSGILYFGRRQLGVVRIRRLLSNLIATMFLWGACALYGAEGTTPPENAGKIDRLVDQLSDGNFQTRRLAQLELAKEAAQNPEFLAAVIPNAPEEEAVRLVRVLEGIFLQHSDHLGDRAERVLDNLSLTSGVAAQEAEAILLEHTRLRQSRARKAIEELGGQLVFMPSTDPELLAARINNPPDRLKGEVLPVLYGIWLHHNWKGTKEDLWHLTRFSACPSLHLYTITGNQIAVDDLLPLASRIRGLTIEQRGACLGIRNDPTTTACIVKEIVPGGAAARAQLLPDDMILQLDDKKVSSFFHLVQLLQEHEIGDQVTFLVRRRFEEIEIPVTLTSWREGLAEDRRFAAPPPYFTGPCGPQPPKSAPPLLNPSQAEPLETVR
ncbi:PDZ domain-containing protein [Planctomicrobium sp. SH664]|uniref:PDZ domain-containing protein n=1 Tax=Planctomicrobium sp. SH664 TaxID=3448125 RepID=UPI003F5C0225